MAWDATSRRGPREVATVWAERAEVGVDVHLVPGRSGRRLRRPRRVRGDRRRRAHQTSADTLGGIEDQLRRHRRARRADHPGCGRGRLRTGRCTRPARHPAARPRRSRGHDDRDGRRCSRAPRHLPGSRGRCAARHPRATRSGAAEARGLGDDPRLGGVREELRSLTDRQGTSGLSTYGRAEIDLALCDLIGGSLEQPVRRLLGEGRASIPTYAMAGWLELDAQRLTEVATTASARSVAQVDAGRPVVQ